MDRPINEQKTTILACVVFFKLIISYEVIIPIISGHTAYFWSYQRSGYTLEVFSNSKKSIGDYLHKFPFLLNAIGALMNTLVGQMPSFERSITRPFFI